MTELAKTVPPIRVFSTTVCPKCKRLKKFLDELGVKYVSMNMEAPEDMAELFHAGVFTYNAPVLNVGNEYITSNGLFQGGKLNELYVKELVLQESEL